MTSEFGWSRTALSGASPSAGPGRLDVAADRTGSRPPGGRLILCIAVFVTGVSTMLLSLTQSLVAFYVLFCLARMNFAGTFDLGIYEALNSWFVARGAVIE